MAKMTETELRIKLRKGGSGGGSSGPTATRVGDTWEYSEAVLYLAYAVSLTNATTSGIIANQSDAVGFQLTPFNASGALLPFRGYMFSKSIYQSGDPTDYTWEAVDIANANASFIRYYSTFSGLLNEIGDPDYPGTMLSGSAVPWLSLIITDPIPATAYFVAEQYTINNVKSEWKVYPVNVDDNGFGLVTYNITTHIKPVLNTAQWDTDVVVAVTAFTGRSYSSVKEIGYGTAVVITYSDGKQTGIYKRNASGIGVWSTPTNFIDGDLLVNGSINTDKIVANSITAGKLTITGPDAVLPSTIGAASAFDLITAVGTLNTAISNAQGSADGKITSYYQDDAPTTSISEGDFWTDTNDGNKLYRYDETTTAWVNIADSDIAQAISDAAGAQGTADGKVTTYLQDAQPVNGNEGDLWIDTDDDNNMYRYNALTTTWVSSRDGTIATAISSAQNAQDTADGKINTYYQTTEPTSMTSTDVGDLWIDTDGGNNQWRWSGTAWIDIQDGDIAVAITNAAGAQGTADGKVTTFYQDAQPANGSEGDLWIDTNDSNKMYRYDLTTTTWISTRDGTIATAIADAATAQNTADGKINTYFQDAEPTGMVATDVGDLWVDTNDNNNQWRYNGTLWVDIVDGKIALAVADAATAQGTADGKVTTFYQDAQPTAEADGDLWIDTNDGNKLYRWAAETSTWSTIQDSSIADALAVANSKINTYWQGTTPTGMHSTNDIGDIWIDTSSSNNQYRYNGATWIDVVDTGIATAISDAAGAQGTADGKVTTFYQTTAPTAEGVGDLWTDTADKNKLYRWSGTGWVTVQDTTVADNIYYSNTTEIDGGNIHTGTVTANKVTLVPADVGAGTASGSNSLRLYTNRIEIWSGGVLRVKLGEL